MSRSEIRVTEWRSEERANVPFCGGVLRLVVWIPKLEVYTSPSSGPSCRSDFEVFYDADGRTVRLTTPDELLRIVEQRGGDPVADVTGAATPFALLVGALLERWRVIVLPELYDFLDPMFDLAVAEGVPRVVDRHLTFVLAKPSELPPGYSVCRVSLDLDTFVVTLAPVAMRRGPAGWGAPAGT